MTDATPATPATPTNPEQVNPETVPAPAVHPEVKDATVEELTSRLRTSLAAWPDTYQLAADDEGMVVFTLADGRRVGVELTIID